MVVSWDFKQQTCVFSYFSNGIFQEDDFGVFMGFKNIQKR
jgi:hypothetical protein